MSRGKKKRSLRDLSRDEWQPSDWDLLLPEIMGTSDRGATIILAAHIEDHLSKLIESKLKRTDKEALSALYQREGALSTMFSTIHLAYAMDLIDPVLKRDLDLIRRIRNAFAHAKRAVNFTTPEVAKAVENIASIRARNHGAGKLYAKLVRRELSPRMKAIAAMMVIMTTLADMNRKRSGLAVQAAHKRVVRATKRRDDLLRLASAANAD